ncbi:hypothetical protein [Moritella marina]|uniref:hypothetical protein n=1 Tax=Moritella marina TaxID=90736 RepID=UPI003704B123
MKLKELLLTGVIATALMGCDSSSEAPVDNAPPVPVTQDVIAEEFRAESNDHCFADYIEIDKSEEITDRSGQTMFVAEVNSACSGSFVEYNETPAYEPLEIINWAKETKAHDGSTLAFQGGHAFGVIEDDSFDEDNSYRGYRNHYYDIESDASYENREAYYGTGYFSDFHHNGTPYKQTKVIHNVDNVVNQVEIGSAYFLSVELGDGNFEEYGIRYACMINIGEGKGGFCQGIDYGKGTLPTFIPFMYTITEQDVIDLPMPTSLKEDYANIVQSYIESIIL